MSEAISDAEQISQKIDGKGDAASVMLAESRFWGQGLHRLLPALAQRRGVADRREGLHQHRTEQLTGERLTAAAASAAT